MALGWDFAISKVRALLPPLGGEGGGVRVLPRYSSIVTIEWRIAYHSRGVVYLYRVL